MPTKRKNKKIKISFSKNKYNLLELILVVVTTLIVGLFIGYILFHKSTISKNNLKEIEEVYNTILNEYINEIDSDTLNKAAIDGMMSILKDKHSVYYNKEQSEAFEIELNGYFYGVGIVIQKDEGEYAIIQTVYKNSPAEKSGIKAKDKIIKIDNVDVKSLTSDEIVNRIRGTVGKEFNLVIERESEQKNVKIVTGKVDIPSVEYKELSNKIGYLNIGIFASNTDEQVKDKLKEIEKSGINKLIIDLRYNNGGGLDTLLNIGSLFLDKDTPIINIETKAKTDTKYSTGNNNKKYQIVILINEYSASASEALAAALNENLDAKLVGVTTYGKGTVQRTKYLKDGSILKYTTETWKTSKGKAIEGVGIKPTIEIKQSDKYFETLKEEDDAQLQKAIDTLK